MDEKDLKMKEREAPGATLRATSIRKVECRVCGKKWDTLSPCALCFASGRIR